MTKVAFRFAQQGLLWLVVAIFMFPINWILLTAIKPPPLIFTFPPTWVFEPTSQNFAAVITTTPFARQMLNSVIVGTVATSLALVIGTFTAYAFARHRYPHQELLQFLFVLPQAIPPLVLVIPLYMIARLLGLLDHPLTLALSYLSFTVPVTTWLLLGFIRELPIELEEAARIDGATLVGVLRFVVIPLLRPGLAAAGIISLLYCWNEFLLALILTGSQWRTAPVGILSFITDKAIEWGELAAAGFLILLPVMAVGIVAQRHLVRGLTSGSSR